MRNLERELNSKENMDKLKVPPPGFHSYEAYMQFRKARNQYTDFKDFEARKRKYHMRR